MQRMRSRAKEIWVLLLLSVSLIASCIEISGRKPFWNDELYTWYLLSDSSLLHMLQAFADKINNTPFLYFGLGWMWARLFGASELSLRLFSAIGFCAAGVLMWFALRRAYSFWAASVGVLAVLCTSELVLAQNAEARMYGLFLAVCALAVWIYGSLSESQTPSNRLLVLNAGAHSAMVHTHLFGLFYSGAMLCALLAGDVITHGPRFSKTRTRVYGSFVLAWLSFVLYLPAFLVQSDAVRPYSWLPVPLRRDLTSFLLLDSAPSLKFALLAILAIGGLRAFAALRHDERVAPHHETRARRLLFLAYLFLAVPVGVWLLSRFVRPVFYDRYLMPTLLGWIVLLAHGAHHLFQSPESLQRNIPARAWNLLPLVLVLILATQPVFYARKFIVEPAPGSSDSAVGYTELPIVVQSSHWFLPRRFYAPAKDRYFYILDWEAANTPDSGRFGIQEYKHLDAIQREFPNLFQGHIVTSEEFLSRFDDFLVLDYADYAEKCPLGVRGLNSGAVGMHCPQWVEKRLLNNAHYVISEVGKVGNGIMLRVRKRESK